MLSIILDWDFDTFDLAETDGNFFLYDVPDDVAQVMVSGWPSPGQSMAPTLYERVDANRWEFKPVEGKEGLVR